MQREPAWPVCAHRRLRRWTPRGTSRCVDGSCVLQPATALAHAIALPLGRDDAGVMRESVEQGRRQLLVARKHGHPLRKREIGCHDGGAALVTVGDQIEEQLTADAVEGHEAELVDNEDIDAQEALLQARELAGVARFEQLAYEIGGARKE